MADTKNGVEYAPMSVQQFYAGLVFSCIAVVGSVITGVNWIDDTKNKVLIERIEALQDNFKELKAYMAQINDNKSDIALIQYKLKNLEGRLVALEEKP